MNFGGKVSIALLFVLAVLGAACGDDDSTDAESEGDGTEETADAGDADTDDAGDGDSVTQNACPADGCRIGFADISRSGDELEVTWELNFDPDINNNHIHIYWDKFSAAQVSNDATDRGVEQGDWVPTDQGPTYVTDGPASTSERGDSTTLCLVAADRDHNVIDESTEVCQDVSELL